jgi:hypothetical protein
MFKYSTEYRVLVLTVLLSLSWIHDTFNVRCDGMEGKKLKIMTIKCLLAVVCLIPSLTAVVLSAKEVKYWPESKQQQERNIKKKRKIFILFLLLILFCSNINFLCDSTTMAEWIKNATQGNTTTRVVTVNGKKWNYFHNMTIKLEEKL